MNQIRDHWNDRVNDNEEGIGYSAIRLKCEVLSPSVNLLHLVQSGTVVEEYEQGPIMRFYLHICKSH